MRSTHATVLAVEEAARLYETYPALTWPAVAVIMGEMHGAWYAADTWRVYVREAGLRTRVRSNPQQFKAAA